MTTPSLAIASSNIEPISQQGLCDLFAIKALPKTGKAPHFRSKASFRPLSLPWNMVRGSCVQLNVWKTENVGITVLNQFMPKTTAGTWDADDKGLFVSLKRVDDGTLYIPYNAEVFGKNYKANQGEQEELTHIFETAQECIRDLIERDQTRYAATRFSDLKSELGLA